MLFSLFACQNLIEPAVYESNLDTGEERLSEEQIEQGITAGIEYWKDFRASELYQYYFEQIEHREPNCPQIFPAVQQSQGWNNDCETSEGWGFSGRSQFRYEQNAQIEEQDYEHWGYFISNFVISSPEDEYFLMQGYGDLRVSEQEKWVELVGSFGNSRDDISWLSEQVSLQLQKSADLEQGIVNISGGVSYWKEFPEDVLAFRFEGLQLEYRDSCQIIEGEVVVAGISGQREVWVLETQDDCEICRENGACWDLSPLGQVEEW